MYKPEKIDILDYIDNLRTNRGTLTEKEEEGVRKTFRSGYCYMFANLLKTAYPGGQIMLAFPHSHVVYQFRRKVYDIEGEIDMSKVDHILIPVTKGIFGLDLYDKFRYGFMHVEDPEKPINISEMMTIYINWFYDIKACYGLVEDVFNDVLKVCNWGGYRKGHTVHAKCRCPGLLETMDIVGKHMNRLIKEHWHFLKSVGIRNEIEESVIYEMCRAFRDQWKSMMDHYYDPNPMRGRIVRDISIYLVKKTDEYNKSIQKLINDKKGES